METLMGEPVMKLTEEQLNDIGLFVKSHIREWIGSDSRNAFDQDDHERLIRLQETVKLGFEQMDKRFEELLHVMDKRFEQVDKRFEQVDKRFEDMQNTMDKRFEQVDKRFENMQNTMDKRFEQVDKRFEGMQHTMGKRFEDMSKRFNQNFAFTTLGFTILAVMMTLYKFLA